MRKYGTLTTLALVVLVTIAPTGCLGYYPWCHFGCVSPDFFVYTGADFSQTVTLQVDADPDYLSNAELGWYANSAKLPDFWTNYALQNGQNSITITKAMMVSQNLGPGIYSTGADISLICYDGYAHICDGAWTSGSWQVNATPVDMDASSQKVTYRCTFAGLTYCDATNAHPSDKLYQGLSSAQYAAYAPDLSQTSGGSVAVPSDPDPTAGEHDFTKDVAVQYTKATHTVRTPQGLAAQYYTIEFSADYPYTFARYAPYEYGLRGRTDCNTTMIGSGNWTAQDREYPSFSLDSVNTSTGGQIEPAYGDTVTYHWHRSYHEFHAKYIALFWESNTPVDGYVYDDVTQKYYKEVPSTEASLSDSYDVTLADLPHQQYSSSGTLSWPSRDGSKSYPQFPPGHFRVGVMFDDGKAEFPYSYVDVGLSIYDVYTDNNAPFYAGDDKEGKTSFYYTMSAPELTTNVGVGGATIWGTANAGKNSLQDAWDGSTSPGDYVGGGSYDLSFDTFPTSPGPLLRIDNMSATGSGVGGTFVPANNPPDTVDIGFDIHEPLPRPQATQASATVVIYDSEGQFVKLLVNDSTTLPGGASVQLDNKATHASGSNLVTWDGKDEQNKVVDPGTYTAVLFARDNAGVGCESAPETLSIDVGQPAYSQTVLEWPTELDEDDFPDDTTFPDGMAGFSASGAPVYASVDGGTPTATTDFGGGLFFVDAPQTPGNHSVIVSTGSGTSAIQRTVDYTVNDASISSPAAGTLLDPQTNGPVEITYNSQIADTVDILVYDPFDQSSCVDSSNPVPAATLMNGTVTSRLVRTMTGIPVQAQDNVIEWDGKDGSGQYVAPGIYHIVVQNENSDGSSDYRISVEVVVEPTSGGPAISGITNTVTGSSVSVSWSTDVSTTGYVVYEIEGIPCGKVNASAASLTHQVWLPGLLPNTTYSYYIVAAENPATGAVSVSQQQAATNAGGVDYPDCNAAVTLSPTEVQIPFYVSSPGVAAVEYAQVGPGVINTQWHRLEDDAVSNQHNFNLCGLQPDAEYVYRIVSAADSTSWANPSVSAFKWFVTKTSLPAVSFPDLQNNQGVSTLGQVTVSASDPTYARFSANGISKVELTIDGQPVTTCTPPASGSFDYTFDTSALNLNSGVHQLAATAYDNFWNAAQAHVTVLLDQGGSGQAAQSASAAMALGVRPMDASQPKGVAKPKRRAHNSHMLCVDDAISKLCVMMYVHDLSDDLGVPVVNWLISCKKQGCNLAKDNPAGVNAICWMIMHYGAYKLMDNLPPIAGRAGLPPGWDKCNVSIADAFVLGNSWENHRLNYQQGAWPISDNDLPIHAAQLAVHKTNVSPLQLMPTLQGGYATAWGYISPKSWIKANPKKDPTHGHCAIFIDSDIIIQGHRVGFVFGSFQHDILDKYLPRLHSGMHPGISLSYFKYPRQ